MARIALGIGCLVLVVSPALVAISQGLLNSAVRNLQAGNCGEASHEALDAIHILSVRPEPYQVLGFCDSRTGQDQLAVQMLETAVDRDPGEWESYYGLALVKGAAGEDPRPAARKAYELAPKVALTQEAVEKFHTDDPQKWRRRAINARLPIL
jgi:tetratricopeptide (TPR) repeat protein